MFYHAADEQHDKNTNLCVTVCDGAMHPFLFISILLSLSFVLIIYFFPIMKSKVNRRAHEQQVF